MPVQSIGGPSDASGGRLEDDLWIMGDFDLWLMEEPVERLVHWNLHPANIITHRFGLENEENAYALMASGKCGKVAVCSDEEMALK
jgi:hypothetical protein